MERIRDENRQEIGRKKRKSDSGEPMKIRNEKRKLQEVPPVAGTVRFYVQTEQQKIVMFNKIDRAKLLIGDKISTVSNAKVLGEVFDFYLKHHGVDQNSEDVDEPENFQPYLQSTIEQCDEKIFLATESSIMNLSAGIQHHGRQCRQCLEVKSVEQFGHVGKISLLCRHGHSYRIDTSSRLPGGKFVVNFRVMHGIYTSGLRYIQYERFAKASSIGCLPDSFFNEIQGLYCEKTEEIASECISEAIEEEMAQTVLECEEREKEYNGITIISDARHGWRKNARHSDVIALGIKSHKVVGSVVVTKSDDNISQRHEMFGVKKLYEHFDNSNVNVNIHGHDRNNSVNKYLKSEKPLVTNANDTWHATKGINREVKKVCDGAQKWHGINWHGELSDKAASIKTHCYYAMRNCDGEKLKSLLDNILQHYQNVHTNCLPSSRCRTDLSYEPSKTIVKDPVALKLLERAIHNLQIYKTPSDYVDCIDTVPGQFNWAL